MGTELVRVQLSSLPFAARNQARCILKDGKLLLTWKGKMISVHFLIEIPLSVAAASTSLPAFQHSTRKSLTADVIVLFSGEDFYLDVSQLS